MSVSPPNAGGASASPLQSASVAGRRQPLNPLMGRPRPLATVFHPTEQQRTPTEIFLTATLIDRGTLSRQEIMNTRTIRVVTPNQTNRRPVGMLTYLFMPTARPPE
jgi:hypothetical protein